MLKIKQFIKEPTMKIITMMVLIASLIAIAGAALFQLFVLLTNTLFGQHGYTHQPRS
jgi:hypothetical protein